MQYRGCGPMPFHLCLCMLIIFSVFSCATVWNLICVFGMIAACHTVIHTSNNIWLAMKRREGSEQQIAVSSSHTAMHTRMCGVRWRRSRVRARTNVDEHDPVSTSSHNTQTQRIATIYTRIIQTKKNKGNENIPHFGHFIGSDFDGIVRRTPDSQPGLNIHVPADCSAGRLVQFQFSAPGLVCSALRPSTAEICACSAH